MSKTVRRQGVGYSGLLWDGIEASDVWRAPADIRERVESHLQDAQKRVLEAVCSNKEFLVRFAERMIQVREIDGQEIAAIEKGVGAMAQ